MRRVSSAFTMIELLVVVGIIAVLVSILVPAVSKVREHSHATTCMSNQRQIYTAIRLFAQSNDKFTQSAISGGSTNLALGKGDICPGASGPVSAQPSGTNGIGQPIATDDSTSQDTIESQWGCRSALLRKGYLGSSKLFRCPERELHPICYNGLLWTPTTYHYAFNVHFVGDIKCDLDGLPMYSGTYFGTYSTAAKSMVPPTLNRPKNPGQCILITEDGRDQGGGQADFVWEMPLGRLQASPVHYRRSPKSDDLFPDSVRADYAICTFLDGHTEPLFVTTARTDANAFTVACDNDGVR